MMAITLGLCEARKLVMALAKIPEDWKGHCSIKRELDNVLPPSKDTLKKHGISEALCGN